MCGLNVTVLWGLGEFRELEVVGVGGGKSGVLSADVEAIAIDLLILFCGKKVQCQVDLRSFCNCGYIVPASEVVGS